MPETSLKWADRIQQAQESAVQFKELEVGEYNVEIIEATVKSGAKGDYLNINFKVIEGPRTNARVFGRTFPNSTSPGGIAMFLRFLTAVGIDQAWLVSNNPSTQEIADALSNPKRKLSLEVYVEDDAKVNEKTGEQFRSVHNYKPMGGTPIPQAQAAPAQQFGSPAAQPVAQPAAQPQGNAGLWNTPTPAAPPADPFR